MLDTGRRWGCTGALVVLLTCAGGATADHQARRDDAQAGPYLGGTTAREDLGQDNLIRSTELADTALQDELANALRCELGSMDLGRYLAAVGRPSTVFQFPEVDADLMASGVEVGWASADIALSATDGFMIWGATGYGSAFGLEQESDSPLAGLGLGFRLAPNLQITGGGEHCLLDDIDMGISSLEVSFHF